MSEFTPAAQNRESLSTMKTSLNTRDAARLLGCSTTMVRNFIKSGKLSTLEEPTPRKHRTVFLEEVQALARERQARAQQKLEAEVARAKRSVARHFKLAQDSAPAGLPQPGRVLGLLGSLDARMNQAAEELESMHRKMDKLLGTVHQLAALWGTDASTSEETE